MWLKLSDLAKRMVVIIGILFGVSVLASAVYYRSAACLPFIWGAILGFGASIAKVLMLDKTVDKAIEAKGDVAANKIRLQHFVRFLLSGAVLLAAALIPGINLWGAAAGILAFQIAVYILNFTMKKKT